MSALLEVVLPVFLVIGFGYVAVWRKLVPDATVDGLMKFALVIAIPCLLFRAVSRLDLAEGFDPVLLGSFYAGAGVGFTAGLLAARFLFGRSWEDSVSIGFCCLYSNAVLLGLPITERAYGAEAVRFNLPIIALHAPFCYLLGICTMEVVKNRGTGGFGIVLLRIGKSLVTNSLLIAIALGMVVNLAGIPQPGVLADALDLVARAGIPTALFGLGGALYHYRPEGDFRAITLIVVVSLLLHPAVVWVLGKAGGLTPEQFRSAVVTAAMPPGVNAYIFAMMYGRATRVAASSVLFATAAAIPAAWFWLAVLP